MFYRGLMRLANKFKRYFLASSIVLLSSLISSSQKPDTLIKKLDSLSVKTDSAGTQNNNIRSDAYNEHTKITGKVYFILLASDFKQQITKPFHMTGKDWGKVGIFALATGALSFADEPVQQFAIKLRNNNLSVRGISSWVTKFGGRYETFLLVGLGAYGFIFKDEKIKTTTLLATQAYITSGLMSDLIKRITGKQRPGFVDPRTNEAEPMFHGPFYHARDINGNKISVVSFPSGHTTAAFSAATVFAIEYRDNPWVPILSYTAATLIGLSRITENKHWITDVFAGAALGCEEFAAAVVYRFR